MNVGELIAYLSQFDSECEVQVLTMESDWAFNGECSYEVFTDTWSKADSSNIRQLKDGTIRLGREA